MRPLNSKQNIIDENTPLVAYAHKGSVMDATELENRRRRLLMELFCVGLLVFLSIPFIFDLGNWSGGAEESIRDEMNGQYTQSFPPKVAGIRVNEDNPSFPSYLSYASHGPINVTYDKRSFMLNGNRALFLSGSVHAARATPQTWTLALDEAVRHGLNMITVYVFWSAHQPFPNQPMDWSLPNGGSDQFCDSHAGSRADLKCNWNLASAIKEAANRGLFVHIRIGPYACAEYNYGGIPEWIPLQNPTMEMRRQNKLWTEIMEKYVRECVGYLEENNLWAHQGGPIILGQIENELQGEEETIDVSSDKKPSIQDHADWCGELVARVAPNVVWTMCNGLSAKNTINTCNGVGGECSISFLKSHGQSGRIQVDQPAMWTELEGGFQIWGEGPMKPTGYFWGRTARSYALGILRWFARGGSQINYYMWWGSYNRGRTAGAGIANIYASDAPMCSSGERRQPKFDHLRALHLLMADIASTLMHSPSAMGHEQPVEKKGKDGQWNTDPKQRMFTYRGTNEEVIFVENDSDEVADLRVPVRNSTLMKMFRMNPTSSVVLVNGAHMYDSSVVSDVAMSYERHTDNTQVLLLNMRSWQHPIAMPTDDRRAVFSDKPIEQTELMLGAGLLSDYAWYGTSFSLEKAIQQATISIDTQKAVALMVFVDGALVGAADTHQPSEGNITLSMNIGDVSKGDHALLILSESLGYSNLIGNGGTSTKAKTKGITGSVSLVGGSKHDASFAFTQNLVDGRPWVSFAGLREPMSSKKSRQRIGNGARAAAENSVADSLVLPPCSWTTASFDTPIIHQKSLFLDITTGRGRIWLNGHDLGRFWNIGRGDESPEPTQRYYFLPRELLYEDGRLNDLLIFNSIGGNHSSMRLVLSWVEPSDEPTFKDEVDFPSACLV